MAVLDELRKMVLDAADCLDGRDDEAIEDAFDAFEAAHPGLVDLTSCGPQCPAHWQGLAAMASTPPLCVVTHRDAPVGHPCPTGSHRSGTCVEASS